MNDFFTPTALEDMRRKLVGKPVTCNGKTVGTVTAAETGYDGVYITMKVDHPRASRWVEAGITDFKVDV